jgi:hypothetical protein
MTQSNSKNVSNTKKSLNLNNEIILLIIVILAIFIIIFFNKDKCIDNFQNNDIQVEEEHEDANISYLKIQTPEIVDNKLIKITLLNNVKIESSTDNTFTVKSSEVTENDQLITDLKMNTIYTPSEFKLLQNENDRLSNELDKSKIILEEERTKYRAYIETECIVREACPLPITHTQIPIPNTNVNAGLCVKKTQPEGTLSKEYNVNWYSKCTQPQPPKELTTTHAQTSSNANKANNAIKANNANNATKANNGNAQTSSNANNANNEQTNTKINTSNGPTNTKINTSNGPTNTKIKTFNRPTNTKINTSNKQTNANNGSTLDSNFVLASQSNNQQSLVTGFNL